MGSGVSRTACANPRALTGLEDGFDEWIAGHETVVLIGHTRPRRRTFLIFGEVSRVVDRSREGASGRVTGPGESLPSVPSARSSGDRAADF